MPMPNSPPNPSCDEAGFTLTELVAGLLVASMLLTGIVELTRRYATTSVRMQTTAEDTANARVLDAMMRSIERIDPGTLDVGPGRVSGEIGGDALTIDLQRPAVGDTQIDWKGPGVNRTLSIGGQLRFALHPSGLILLESDDGEQTLASVRPMRDAPIDCRFDTVSRTCR